MKPGRELDALIAEKVMGLKPEEFNRSYGPIEIMNDGPPLKFYSTNIKHAWEVVEYLIGKNLETGTLENDDFELIRFAECWGCSFYDYPHTEGESASHAICLAALQALKIKV